MYTQFSCWRPSSSIESSSPVKSSTLEKIAIVISTLLAAVCLATATALFFTQVNGVQFPHYVMLGGAMTFAASFGVAAFYKLREKNNVVVIQQPPSLPILQVPPPVLPALSMESTIQPRQSLIIGESLTTNFVNWLMESMPVLPLVDKTHPATQKVLEEIKKKHLSLLEEPEFYWLNSSVAQASEISENLKNDCNEAAKALQKHWDKCAQGYPKDAIETAFQGLFKTPMSTQRNSTITLNATVNWFILVPFFVRFFKCLENDRSQILPWLQTHLEECLKARFAMVERPIVSRLKENTSLIFSLLFQLLIPLNHFVGNEDFKGRQFLLDSMHLIAFQGLPNLLEREVDWIIFFLQSFEKKAQNELKEYASIKKIIENSTSPLKPILHQSFDNWKVRIEQTAEVSKTVFFLYEAYLAHVLPTLSKEILEPQGNLGPYVEEILSLKNQKQSFTEYQAIHTHFAGVKAEKTFLQPKYSDLLDFRPVMDQTFDETLRTITQVATITFPQLVAGKSNRQKKVELGNSIQQGTLTTITHIKTILSNTPSLGDFVAKSYLIAHELPNVYSTANSRKSIAEQSLMLLLAFLENAGASKLEVDQFKAFSNEKIGQYLGELNKELTDEEREIRKWLPLQDVILGMLFLIFTVRNSVEIVSGVQKHGGVVVETLKELKIAPLTKKLPKFQENIHKINRFGNLITGALKQEGLGKVLQGGASGVNAVVNVFTTNKKSVLAREIGVLFQELTKESRKDPKLTKTVEFFDKFLQPLITRIFCGVYEKGSPAESALNKFEQKLKADYQNLYNFSPEQIGDIQEFQTTLRAKFARLLTSPFDQK